MSTIYFNNFRGFKATILDLKGVNFFVGENSTGKTSVLKLIGILSSPGFWRYNEFGKDETALGGFDEICTSGEAFFDVGILSNDIDPESLESMAIKLTFIGEDNFPSLKQVCVRTENYSIQAFVSGKDVKYRFTKSKISLSIKSFRTWIRSSELNELVFESFENKTLGVLPLLMQLIQITSLKSGDSNGGNFNGLSQFKGFLYPFAWIAPIRAEPQKIYEFQGLGYYSKGKHAPSVLKEIMGPIVKKILNRFGSDSGLYEDIDISDLSEAKPNSYKFEVLVRIKGNDRNIANVGFGVSQVLPILIEVIARPDNTWFAAQQPEVHLHPRAQAALGEFIFKSYKVDNQRFLIETHSDFTINRFRLRLNRAMKRSEDISDGFSQIVFFRKRGKGDGNSLVTIVLNADGSYPKNQPEEFRDFFLREQLDILTI